MTVPRWTTTLEPKVDGWEWTVDFHAGVAGRLQGWQTTEGLALMEAEQFAEMVSGRARENRQHMRDAATLGDGFRWSPS